MDKFIRTMGYLAAFGLVIALYVLLVGGLLKVLVPEVECKFLYSGPVCKEVEDDVDNVGK